MTFGSLSIFNSLFQDCEGRDGGAISGHASLTIDCVRISRCVGKIGGAFDLRAQGSDFVSVNRSVIAFCRADFFGSFYRSSKGACEIRTLNCSGSRASECVGTAEMKWGAVQFRFVSFSDSSAKAHNGGLCIRDLESMTMDSCIFAGCRHTSGESEAAAALLLYENPANSVLQNCFFLQNFPDRTSVLTVAGGQKLTIRNCCFSGKQYTEIRDRHVTVIDCNFEQRQCEGIQFPEFVAFDESLGKRTPVFGAAEAKKVQMPSVKRSVREILLISTGVSCVAAGILTLVHVSIQRILAQRIKIPRALK
jgi:hypothetical protein